MAGFAPKRSMLLNAEMETAASWGRRARVAEQAVSQK
jgi:hypothetical protein